MGSHVIHDIAAAEAYEARYITQSAKDKHPALVVWGPNADLARDPRWGRNNESYGEDPFFDGVMATAYSKGLQGDNPKYWQTASLLKHFLANSNETTRGGSSSDFDNALFWDYYSTPFRMAIQQGGAKSFMASYNAWNKVPMTVNPIIDEVVIKQWEANGIFSSDATAVEQMADNHKYFKDQPTALAAAIKAGISQIISFGPPLPGRVQEALKAKLLTEADIDNALRGKFRTVIWLGLLDPPAHNPYVAIGESGEPEPWTTDKHKDLSLNVAHKSIVLLKNANNTLPLNVATLRSIAVIGPRANDNPIDMYAGVPPYSITPIEGVKRKLRPQTILHHVDDNNMDLMIQAAKEAEVAVVVVGNHPSAAANSQSKSSTPTPPPSPVLTRPRAAKAATASRLICRRKTSSARFTPSTHAPSSCSSPASPTPFRGHRPTSPPSCNPRTHRRTKAPPSPMCSSATTIPAESSTRPGPNRSRSFRPWTTTTSATAAPTCTSKAILSIPSDTASATPRSNTRI